MSYYSREETADRRLAVLRDVANGIDLDGAPPTVRRLAELHSVTTRTATVDVEVLIETGMLRRLGTHQPRQRARLAVTDDGRRALAVASSPTGAS